MRFFSGEFLKNPPEYTNLTPWRFHFNNIHDQRAKLNMKEWIRRSFFHIKGSEVIAAKSGIRFDDSRFDIKFNISDQVKKLRITFIPGNMLQN
jgi:hypothetical protein